MSHRLSVVSSSRRLTALSSTTRTGMSCRRLSAVARGRDCRRRLLKVERHREMERAALPASLSSQMRPPSSATRLIEIASPSPVPPYLRVVEPSAWMNGLKIAFAAPAGCRCRYPTR